MAREKRHRAGRILIGIGIMIIVAATPFVVLSKFAGGWGVPYFTFVTDRGTTCTNDFTGYHCDNLTRADIIWWSDAQLPQGTRLIRSHYKSTNDFSLDALVQVPAAESKQTLAALGKTFGPCRPDHPTQLTTPGLTHLCVRANDATEEIESSKPLSDVLYEVSSGYRKSGDLLVAINEQSR